MAATSETRNLFEQLLKKAERKKGKDKKPLVTEKESEIVENLERSLKKDDPLSENNTYDEEAEKNLKNLRNSGQLKGKENQDSTELIENAEDPVKKVSKEKKKKARKKDETQTTKEEAVYAVVNKPSVKKRNKKKEEEQDSIGNKGQLDDDANPVPVPREPRSNNSFVEKGNEDAETTPKALAGQAEEEETVPKTVVRKKRKKRPAAGTSRALPEVSQNEAENEGEPETEGTSVAGQAVEQPPTSHAEDDGTIMGITVHNCDYIRIDPKYTSHPLVKVSIVDSMTGKYITKYDTSRPVSSYYESDTVDTIVPLLTQPYDFKANGSLLPRWEERLLFNESFTRLTDPTAANKPIVFFVIRDFVAMEKANNARGGSDKGWYNIAWAFLKLVSNNGRPNAGKKMRLQLFYPPRTRASQASSVDMAHDWWLNHPRQRYPGTLYVTLKAIPPPGDMESSLRSLFALQKEESSLTYNQLNESLEHSASESHLQDQLSGLAEIQQWSRLPGQTCKIPNSPFKQLRAGWDGAFMMQFSPKGTRLAVACRHGSTYPIFVYSIPGGNEVGTLIGHQQLVYDLKWSKNSRFLLSASADGTAQVWDVEQRDKPFQTLPHPCYVYTASYHPVAFHLIATGGYDSIVRVWNIASKNSQLTQELDGHKAMVNSIIFDSAGLNMFSGDGAGLIICWDCRSYEKAKMNVKTNWKMKYKIEDRDLTGICINHLQLHPRNNKILIHCRDSTLRLLDSRIHSIKKFTGLINYRQLLRSSITPCGTLIFSGSEDGCVYVWNVETGDQVAIYNELGYTNAVHTAAYHPHDHMVAFCSYSPNQSVLIYKFDSAVATMEAGFKPMDSMEVKEDDPSLSIHAHIEAARTAVNLDRVKSKLDSVLAEPLDLSPRSVSPYRRGAQMSPLESTLDDSTHIRGSILAPSYLSPHASAEARALAHQYIRTGRQEQKAIPSVGGSPYKNGPAPDVSFTTDKDGNQMLNINAPPGTPQQSLVVVLFEYEANRSDELSFVRGDLIKVLYKDSANWWFGEKLSDGKQGYFPSNYVEEQVSTSQIQKSNTDTPVFGVPESNREKKVYALKMPGGRLNFYSQSESEGDDDRLSNASIGSRQRRRDARLRESLQKSQRELSPLTTLNTSTKGSATTYPKSILLKESTKPKAGPLDPSEPPIKEVSFADEKNEKNPKARQNLMESIQAALKQAELDKDSSTTDPTTCRRNEQSTRPRPVARKTSQKKSRPKSKSPLVEETTFTEAEKSEVHSSTTKSKLAPTFGILKSVQALMNKNDDSEFSQSVVGGHAISTPVKSGTNTFKPAVHSTAIKKPRRPVENEDQPSPDGSTVRRARPLPKVGAQQSDEEAIPMVKMSRSKSNESTLGRRGGSLNPAFVADT